MKKVVLILIISIFLFFLVEKSFGLNVLVSLQIPKKIFLSNETIPLSIEVINKEEVFKVKNASLQIIIGRGERARIYFFEIGDLRAKEKWERNLTLPEFPPGNYLIHGTLTYLGYFDEIVIEDVFTSFNVRFPEVKLIPNVIIKNFTLPVRIFENEEKEAKVVIENIGGVEGEVIVKISSMELETNKTLLLLPGEKEEIIFPIKFPTEGVKQVEVRVYAKVDGNIFLLDYRSKKLYVEKRLRAQLIVEKVEVVDELDGVINSIDRVKIAVYLKNIGNLVAGNIKSILSSTHPRIKIIEHEYNYKVIIPEASEPGYFEIETENVEVGTYNLEMSINYSDFTGRYSFTAKVPIFIQSGSNVCVSDEECLPSEICEGGQCKKIECECGRIINHKCMPFECCSDLDCEEGYVCDRHVCKPIKEIKADVLIVTSSKLKSSREYEEVLREYREILLEEGLTSFYILLDSEKVKELFNIEPANVEDWKSVKKVLDKIIYKIKPTYLLIIGGVDVIPQPPAKTTAEIPTIPVSDDRYVDLDLDGKPEIAVGRIPSPIGGKVDIVISALQSSISIHKHNMISPFGKMMIADACGVSIWRSPVPPCILQADIAFLSFNMFGRPCRSSPDCYTAPPYCMDLLCEKRGAILEMLQRPQVLAIHAHANEYGFYAEGILGKVYLILTSAELRRFIYNPLFLTVGCYAGKIDCDRGCVSERGNVFSFLKNGVAAYIGNTRYGYMMLRSAKPLAKFYDYVRGGDSLGVALLKMKRDFLKQKSEWHNAIIYEIQLYGDPTIKLRGI